MLHSQSAKTIANSDQSRCARVSVKIHFAKKIEARRASTATAQGNALGDLIKILQPVGLLENIAALQAAIIYTIHSPGRCPGLLQLKSFGL